MRGARAKQIRGQAYVHQLFRDRKYYKNKTTGQIIADEKRREYQKLKDEYVSNQ